MSGKSPQNLRIRTPFPYGTTHDGLRIPLSDGTRPYARVWRPP
jgi:uncharacterized protein